MTPDRLRPRHARTALLVALAAWGVLSVVARLAGAAGPLMVPFGPRVSASVMGVAALVVLARRQRAWTVAGAGLLVWTVADLVTLTPATAAFAAAPAFAVVYLSGSVLLGSGLALHLRDRRRPGSALLRLDALTCGLAVAGLVSWVLVDPVRGAIGPDAPFGIGLLHVALTTSDSLLLVLAVVGLALLRWRADRTWMLCTAAAAAFLVAEGGFALGAGTGSWSPQAPTNAGWSGAAVLLALAAWSPRPALPVRDDEPGVRDVILPSLLCLGSVGMLVAAPWLAIGALPVALAATSLVTALARLVLTALEHAVLLRASRVEARTDSLTGLGNRRRLDGDLEAAFVHTDAPTALVLFDLDGFKGFNDRHGHPAGDALLTALGGELAAHVGVAHAYRLGGDELCALVTAPGEASLTLAVDNAAAVLCGAAERAGIGASHGAVVLREEAGDSSAALRIADRRLYGDKARRHRAVTAQSA